MHIDDRLVLVKPPLSQEQRDILAHDEGPLLIIAGPGSGKTYSLIRRAMNILLQGKAEPSQLILCTHTDKAANEMRSRFMVLAQEVGYQEDLSQLHIGTIHSICNQLVTEYRHLTRLGNDYTVLDQFAQRFFIFQHLKVIDSHGYFQNKWEIPQWEVADQLREYFDKIMEELIEHKRLTAHTDAFLCMLGRAYNAYCTLLIAHNRVSYAAQLKIAHDLLHNESHKPEQIIGKFRYVFVDEYQDTNYIQERIVRRLASHTGNLCVVGDEDQGLYRFRGATVRNILEFKHNTPACRELLLTTNYRSHKDIITRYDLWMKSHKWHNDDATKPAFRREKTISHVKEKVYSEHPAILHIEEQTPEEEAKQFTELVFFLKEQQIISDYNQVALLLKSVKPEHSDVYKEALDEKKIPVFCPRARSYFLHKEVCLLIASFARILDYPGELEDELLDYKEFSEYIKKCFELLDTTYDIAHPLQVLLQTLRDEVMHEDIQQDSQASLADYFYRLLATEPFVSFMGEEQKMRNLVIFSKELQTFQGFYKHSHVTLETYQKIRFDFFHVFLRLLKGGGRNEYEDAEQPFPTGHVQILTIHQAKGLEFPVVVVGSLDNNQRGAQRVDRMLESLYKRKKFEEEKRIQGFDMMRLYYVAFSRAEQLLVLTSNSKRPVQPMFEPMIRNLPQWPTIKCKMHIVPQSATKTPSPMKQRYSLTGHIQMYEMCARKYQYFHEYSFVKAQQREVLLGLPVHNTLEEIHRRAKNRIGMSPDELAIQTLVNKVYRNLLHKHNKPVDEVAMKQEAHTQVWNYVRQNLIEMRHIKDIEVDVPIEKEGYILTGRIDVLRERDGKLELLDFKTDYRPAPDDARLVDYERQLFMYASALEKRTKMRPEQLIIYCPHSAVN